MMKNTYTPGDVVLTNLSCNVHGITPYTWSTKESFIGFENSIMPVDTSYPIIIQLESFPIIALWVAIKKTFKEQLKGFSEDIWVA